MTVLFVLPFAILFAVLIPALRPDYGKADFISYWSTAHLLVTRGNPYDSQAIQTLQMQVYPEHYTDNDYIVVSWNPPWLMLTLAPVALLAFEDAVPAWIFFNICIFGLAVFLLWKMLYGPEYHPGYIVALAAGFLFFETLLTISMGQISSLVLIGLVLGVWCLRSNHDALAGAAFLLTTIKPQLTYLVWPLLLVWLIRQRRWRFFLGLSVAIGASVVMISILYPGWLLAYWKLMNSFPYSTVSTATLGCLIDGLTGIKIFRMAGILTLPLFVPLLRLLDKKDDWTAFNLALLVSVPLSPYGFSFDHVVLLPAIVQMAIWLLKREIPPVQSHVFVICLLATYILRYLQRDPTIMTYLFVWQPFALCFIYLIIRKYRGLYGLQQQTA